MWQTRALLVLLVLCVLSQKEVQHSAEIAVADFAKMLLLTLKPAVKLTLLVITANPLGDKQRYAPSAILTLLVVPVVTLVRERSRVLFKVLSIVVADVFLQERMSATFNPVTTINAFSLEKLHPATAIKADAGCHSWITQLVKDT